MIFSNIYPSAYRLFINKAKIEANHVRNCLNGFFLNPTGDIPPRRIFTPTQDCRQYTVRVRNSQELGLGMGLRLWLGLGLGLLSLTT